MSINLLPVSYWHEYLDLMFFFKAINGSITVPKEILPKRSVPSSLLDHLQITVLSRTVLVDVRQPPINGHFLLEQLEPETPYSGVTLYQGPPPVQSFRRPPIVEVPKARVERCICTSFLGVRACSPGTFLNLDSMKCHFPNFGERFYRILTVRKRHCDISEALTNVFALQPEPGGPHLAHWGWGPPGSPGPSA